MKKRILLHILAWCEPMAARLYRVAAGVEPLAERLYYPCLVAKDALWVRRENRRAAR